MSQFPAAVPVYVDMDPAKTLSQNSHTAGHNSVQAEIIALATKLGIGASTPASGLVLRGTGVGTSAWGALNLSTDVTGTLPVANGGTGATTSTGSGPLVLATSPSLVTPSISNPTITGGGSWSGSPTIITPTIASFANSNHTHQNSAGGSVLTAAALPALDLSVQTLYKPYKFFVYLGTAQNTINGFTKILYDTELYDTGNNFDSTTNHRFVAPVNGFYHFDVMDNTTNGSAAVNYFQLYKNGSAFTQGPLQPSTAASVASGLSLTIQLAANDYIEVYHGSNVAQTNLLSGGSTPIYNYFSGYLESHT